VSTSTTTAGVASSPVATQATAATKDSENNVQARVIQTALASCTDRSPANQRPQAWRRRATRSAWLPVTRSSLPGAGVVATAKT
jgi:hypothetical protein